MKMQLKTHLRSTLLNSKRIETNLETIENIKHTKQSSYSPQARIIKKNRRLNTHLSHIRKIRVYEVEELENGSYNIKKEININYETSSKDGILLTVNKYSDKSYDYMYSVYTSNGTEVQACNKIPIDCTYLLITLSIIKFSGLDVKKLISIRDFEQYKSNLATTMPEPPKRTIISFSTLNACVLPSKLYRLPKRKESRNTRKEALTMKYEDYNIYISNVSSKHHISMKELIQLKSEYLNILNGNSDSSLVVENILYQLVNGIPMNKLLKIKGVFRNYSLEEISSKLKKIGITMYDLYMVTFEDYIKIKREFAGEFCTELTTHEVSILSSIFK